MENIHRENSLSVRTVWCNLVMETENIGGDTFLWMHTWKNQPLSKVETITLNAGS